MMLSSTPRSQFPGLHEDVLLMILWKVRLFRPDGCMRRTVGVVGDASSVRVGAEVLDFS